MDKAPLHTKAYQPGEQCMVVITMCKKFLRAVGILFVTSIVASTSLQSNGQVVFVGPPDPEYCKKIEQIRPNLILKRKTHVYGVITDTPHNPIARKSVVLRSYLSPNTQQTLRSVQTDDLGRFDLGDVRAGRYRLLASWTRSFRQPDTLKCPESGECDLQIALVAPPTDGPDSVCPVK
jgi:hypothetical protein